MDANCPVEANPRGGLTSSWKISNEYKAYLWNTLYDP